MQLSCRKVRWPSANRSGRLAYFPAGLHNKFKTKLWAEFAYTRSKMANMVVTRKQPVSPFKMFYNKDPPLKIRDLRPPGSVGYMSNPTKKVQGAKFRTGRGTPVILCGYADDHAPDVYRLFNVKTHGLSQTRNVKFKKFTPVVCDEHLRDELKSSQDDDSSDDTPNESSDEGGNDYAYDDDYHIETFDLRELYDSDDESDDDDDVTETTESSDSNDSNDSNQSNDSNRDCGNDDANDSNDDNANPVLDRELGKLRTSYNDGEIIGELNSDGITTRSKSREVNALLTLISFVFNVAIQSDPTTPKSFQEAVTGPDKEKWIAAIRNEFEQFLSRGTWIKTLRSEVKKANRKPIPTKHVFKIKSEHDGSLRYKDRVVIKGYMAIPGVDYTESFSPVVTDTGCKVVLSIYLYKTRDGWIIEMIDYEAAFLNAELTREVYAEFPEGMVELGYMTQEEVDKYVAKLGSSMYGNVDAALLWFNTLIDFLTSEEPNGPGLLQSKSDPCILYKRRNDETVLLCALTVDDSLIAGKPDDVKWLKTEIEKRFNITHLGRLRKHLGVYYDFDKDSNDDVVLKASMPAYEKEMIDLYEEIEGRPAKKYETPGTPGTFLAKNTGDTVKPSEYRSMTGKIMHWTRKIAPETNNAMRELSQHMKNPGTEHWQAIERFVGYVRNGEFKHLCYRRPKEFRVVGYSDANYAQNTDDRKSVSGQNITIDERCTVDDASNTQKVVSLSSAQSEYQACSKMCQGIVFIHSLCDEVMGEGFVKKPALVKMDNKGAIFMIRNQQTSQRTRHIDIRHHWLRDLQAKGIIEVVFCPTDLMTADIDTTNCSVKLFRKHARKKRNLDD